MLHINYVLNLVSYYLKKKKKKNLCFQWHKFFHIYKVSRSFTTEWTMVNRSSSTGDRQRQTTRWHFLKLVHLNMLDKTTHSTFKIDWLHFDMHHMLRIEQHSVTGTCEIYERKKKKKKVKTKKTWPMQFNENVRNAGYAEMQKRTDGTVRRKRTLALLHTKRNWNVFSVFTQSERQSSEFGTLDLENISAIKSYIGSLAARSRLFAVLAGYVLFHVCADIASTEMP